MPLLIPSTDRQIGSDELAIYPKNFELELVHGPKQTQWTLSTPGSHGHVDMWITFALDGHSGGGNQSGGNQSGGRPDYNQGGQGGHGGNNSGGHAGLIITNISVAQVGKRNTSLISQEESPLKELLLLLRSSSWSSRLWVRFSISYLRERSHTYENNSCHIHAWSVGMIRRFTWGSERLSHTLNHHWKLIPWGQEALVHAVPGGKFPPKDILEMEPSILHPRGSQLAISFLMSVCSDRPLRFDIVPEKLEVSLIVSKPGLGKYQKSSDRE